MALYTVEQQLTWMREQVRKANERAEEAMRYAEATARLHHRAICALNHALTGSSRFPTQPD